MRRARCSSLSTRLARTARAVPLALGLVAMGSTAGSGQSAAPMTSGATRADSLALLARLDVAVTAPEANASTWHARGLLAWQLAQGKRAAGGRADREQVRLNQAADESLLRAVSLEPRNLRFLADFATYRSLGSPLVRAGATRYLRQAMELAVASGDSLVIAQTADQLGMLAFREYQAMFGRRQSLDNGPSGSIADILVQQSGPDGRSVSAGADVVRQAIESRSSPIGGNPPPGVDAFDLALEYFETATRAAPALPLPWRHRFAALADRRRWEELLLAASERLASAPWDPDAWLALGLARHRAGGAEAMTAFDSAFALMTPDTRARLGRVERIMRPAAVKALAAMPPEERTRTERFVWTAADPLWSVPGNEVRAEYLARVAFAQLRFTDEEQRVHGVDTYPGELHVRYGFPQVTANFSCAGADAEAASAVCWFWWFAPRVQFMVRYLPIFNRSRAGFDDVAVNEEIIAQAPATWVGLANVPRIDSLALRVARFRADGAHPSVLVTGTVPLSRMSAEGVRGGMPTAWLWMFTDGADAVARDSVPVGDDGLAAWRLRVPSGDLYARAEALIPGGGAARGSVFAPAVGASPTLAMSDVVVAAEIRAPGGTARRWHELEITPAPDTLPRARSIALAWEIYNLGTGEPAPNYHVRLVLEKASKSLAGRIVAQIGGLVGAQRGTERVTLEFSRRGVQPGTSVDHVALSLREAPSGRYTLTVQISDPATGQRTARAVPLIIGSSTP